MGLGGHNLDANALLQSWQKHAIQYASVGFASVSVCCCLVSLYWFMLMRRNFRRTLIMLLLFADLFKSSWLLVFPAVSLARGGVETGSPFCDVGGFFLQAGIESCDVAILLMSLHMSLQVFNPTSSRVGPDGLYRYRKVVYVVWIILPSFMAALAFVRTGKGSYLSQGAFCTLAIRPFWYRLALSWIPRYLVWAYVTYTAIRIYLRVGTGFTVFARVASSTGNRTDQSRLPTVNVQGRQATIPKLHRARSYVSENIPLPFLKLDPNANNPFGSGSEHGSGPMSCDTSPTKSTHKPSRDSLAPDAAYHLSAFGSTSKSRQGSHVTTASSNIIDYGAAEPGQGADVSGQPLDQIISPTDNAAVSRRRAIQRQTRLLFIYPCVYMICMVIPFVQHCFNYSDYYAQHPVFVISLLGPICFAIMGTADSLIFCWREKPWAAIPGSDGSFLGSFCFWRYVGPYADRSPRPGNSNAFQQALRQYNLDASADPEASPAKSHASRMTDPVEPERPGTSDSTSKKFLRTIKVIRPPHRRAFSGNSDQAALAAERAAERLALERAAHAQRMLTLAEKSQVEEAPKKEWYDREEELLDEEDEDDDQGSVRISPMNEEEVEQDDAEDLAMRGMDTPTQDPGKGGLDLGAP